RRGDEIAVDICRLRGGCVGPLAVVGDLDPALVQALVEPLDLLLVELELRDDLVQVREADTALLVAVLEETGKLLLAHRRPIAHRIELQTATCATLGRMVWWEIIFMLVVLKIPIVYLCAVVWWAIRAEPLPDDGADGAFGDGSDRPGPRPWWQPPRR